MDVSSTFRFSASSSGMNGGKKKTYAKLNGSGEELDTGGLHNLITAGHTGQVDKGGLNDALLTLGSLDHSLGEAFPKTMLVRVNKASLDTENTNRKPAKAMDKVAEPAPSLALTTSSPPN